VKIKREAGIEFIILSVFLLVLSHVIMRVEHPVSYEWVYSFITVVAILNTLVISVGVIMSICFIFNLKIADKLVKFLKVYRVVAIVFISFMVMGIMFFMQTKNVT
jgi:hypothetical protein